MSNTRLNASVIDVAPNVTAPLDPGFRPMVLAIRAYRKAVADVPERDKICLAVERNRGLITRMDFDIFPADSPYAQDTFRYVERTIKFLLWARGGWKLHLSGPAAICEQIKAAYAPGGERAFDADLMAQVYGRPFEVSIVAEDEVPASRETSEAVGGNMAGCRIGFDLGASDYKLAAVIDGEAVFSTEIPWDPKEEADPAYHRERINEGLKLAASKMPRVDAIGGSSAGVYIDNQPMVASLFRSVPRDQFESVVKPMFINLGKEWNVPLVILNDGDVTALAAALSLETTGILGIAMGSSLAAGYLDQQGKLTGWLNELAFAPVDMNPDAVADEWSGDTGVGALYFSQQAVNKLAPAAGLSFDPEMGLPERLKVVQAKMAEGDEAVRPIYETIGVYLAYTMALYAEFYDINSLLILGRVTSGEGGVVLLERAREVLAQEFPELSKQISLNVPDEKSRRVGQAVAAASLPSLSNCVAAHGVAL